MPINGYVEGNGPTASQSGGGGYYQLFIAATLAACKVKIFAAGGGELGSGAYPAAVLTDIVSLISTWRKFQ
jgi:hypothetical protein